MCTMTYNNSVDVYSDLNSVHAYSDLHIVHVYSDLHSALWIPKRTPPASSI